MSVRTYHYCFEDEHLGTVYVRINARATHIVFRAKEQHIWITSPLGITEKEMQSRTLLKRKELLQLLNKVQQPTLIDQHFRLDTNAFHFRVQFHDKTNLRVKHESPASDNHTATLYVPQGFIFAEHQQWLEKIIIESVRTFAHPYLYGQLRHMSALSGLGCEQMGIGIAHTRWGVCARKNDLKKPIVESQRPQTITLDIGGRTREEYCAHKIIFSVYTALLPLHLSQFIILHELTHTRHPDHSPSFHDTLDKLTQAILGLSEEQCEQQLKKYQTNIYSFLNQ